MAALEVENLQSHFRTMDDVVNRAMNGVSFQVREGDDSMRDALDPRLVKGL